jgi:hypothetical protein
MPAGRPTKLTKALEKQIAELFWLAFTDEQVATIVGINERTIRRYRAGDFCPAIKIAELQREAIYRKRIWAAKGYWQGAAWMLERKYPSQFAKPEIQMQITNNTLNQTTNNCLVISAEAAEGVISRIQSADAKVGSLFKKRNGNQNGHKTVEE